jgi:uncharacterized membrane protein
VEERGIMNTNVSMQRRSNSPWALTTRRVVFAAIFAALTLALGGVGFGFIPVPNLSGAGTILHIPTILGAIIGGPIVGMICGAIFGVMALIAFPAFSPLVHIPSRLLIGLVSWAVYAGLRKANVPIVIAAIVAAIAGSLTNTVVTVGMALLIGQVNFPTALTFIPQAITELIFAAVLTPVIVMAVNSIPNARGD